MSLQVEVAPQVTTTSPGTTFVEPNNPPGQGAVAAAAAAVAVDAGVTAANIEIDYGEAGATLHTATVQITGNYQSGGDVLSFTANAATMGNIYRDLERHVRHALLQLALGRMRRRSPSGRRPCGR